MTATVALQALLAGLSLGSGYGLIAMGFSLIRRLTGLVNLAHGDVVVGATLLAAMAVLGPVPNALGLSAPTSVAYALTTLAFGAVVSVLVGVVVVGPFRISRGAAGSREGAHEDDPEQLALRLAATLVIGLAFRAALDAWLAQPGYALPDTLHLDRLTTDGLVHLPGGAVAPARTMGVLGIGLALGVAGERLLTTGRTGREIRAVSDNPRVAALHGLSVTTLTTTAFAIAGALAAAAGLLVAPDRTIGADTALALGVGGMAAAVLGGLGSVRGAIAGGLLLGVVQALLGLVPSAGLALGDLLPAGILVGGLVVRARPGRLIRTAR